MIRRPRAALALAAAACVAATLAACDVAERATPAQEAEVTIEGLFPAFDPEKSRYVSRCGRGDPPIRVDAGEGTSVAVGPAPSRSGEFRIKRGAPPGADFQITVDSGTDSGVYRVRCLPADFPRWRFEQMRHSPPGLFSVSFNPHGARPWIVVFDHSGVPRWWFNPDTRTLWAQILEDGSVSWARSFGDGYGLDPRMAHEVRSLSGELERVVKTEGSIIDGHEFRELGNGNVLVDTYAPGSGVDLSRFGGPADAAAVFAEIQEIDRQGRVVWRWNSRGRIGLGETGRWWRNVLSNPKPGQAGAELFDPVHINSIEPRGPDELVLSTRHTDAVYAIDRSTGRIDWKLGGTETPESLRILGDPATKLFGGQHDPRVGPDGTLSIYDNGKDRPRLPRVVFYRLDEGQRTATYLGQLNDPQVKTSHCCGSARPLADGGWLVSWGDNPVVSAFDEEGRMLFRFTLTDSTFRAVPVPEGAVTVAELDRSLEAMERKARMN
jgi:outer membrane protein assembly factor BamB